MSDDLEWSSSDDDFRQIYNISNILLVSMGLRKCLISCD